MLGAGNHDDTGERARAHTRTNVHTYTPPPLPTRRYRTARRRRRRIRPTVDDALFRVYFLFPRPYATIRFHVIIAIYTLFIGIRARNRKPSAIVCRARYLSFSKRCVFRTRRLGYTNIAKSIVHRKTGRNAISCQKNIFF